jgi:phosphomannomutase
MDQLASPPRIARQDTAPFVHRFHPAIVREYDIRGTIGKTLGVADGYAIGRAFGRMLNGKRVATGYDGRHSSPDLEMAVVEGLADAGCSIERIGRGPTPMLYFAVHHLGSDAGVMVTGSHNPPDENGFKLVIGGAPVFGDRLRQLASLAAAGVPPGPRGSIKRSAVFDAYVARLLRDYDGRRTLRVAWDPGNGAAGETTAAVTAQLPGTHVLINQVIDGDFPAHHPDPTIPENLVQLQDAVRRNECDLGIGFDGDGDRIGVVDEHGRIIWADQVLALLAGNVLARNPGATIIADVKASQVLFDEIARHGGVPLMWKSGHALLRSKLAEIAAPLAGEMSGHVFFGENFYGHDDALYVAIRLLGMLSRSGERLSTLRDRLPSPVNTPEIRFPCDEESKFTIVAAVKDHLARAGASVNDLDGVRVTMADGWWLLRASNTQAVLVARCEAASAEALARVKADLFAALAAAGVQPPAM